MATTSSSAGPTIDPKAAARFIRLLTGEQAAQVTFQTFVDDPKAKGRGGLARVIHGSIAGCGPELARLNARGAGVFVTVNETDLEGRSVANVVGLSALFVDADEKDGQRIPPSDELTLRPHIRVRSGGGEHAYWLLQPGEPLSAFGPAQLQLAAALGTDAAVHDLPRVMRVPGFLHQKDPAAPKAVMITEANDGPLLSIAGVLAAFPPPDGGRGQTSTASAAASAAPANYGPRLFDRANAVPIDAIAAELGLAVRRVGEVLVADCPRGCSGGTSVVLLPEPNVHKCSHNTCANVGPPGGSGTRSPVDLWAEVRRIDALEAARAICIWRGLLPPARNGKPRPRSTAARHPSIEIKGAPRPGKPFTDLGNAERYAQQHAEDVRHCKTLGGWYAWDGARWLRDEVLDAQRRAHLTARSIYAEVEELAGQIARERSEERRKELAALLDAARAWAKKSEAGVRLSAMIGEARAIPPIPVAQETFDADHTALLLNAPNGTLDLELGELRPHDRADLITRVCGMPYDSRAEAPRFLRFLEEILPNPEVRAWMRRWAGYCATGVIREHVLPIWYGTGANGKGTLATLIEGVLGDYAIGCPEGFFEETKHRGHQTEIARLRGARLAVASESERAVHLAEAKVKKLTGGESLTGNFMRCDFFTFKPTCKFVLFTNHKPRIRSADDGIRRRVILVNFGVSIPSARRKLDLCEDLLDAEGPGILRWIVDGARELLADGGRLNAPAVIRAATDEYLEGEDVVGRFFDEACTVTKAGDRGLRSKPAHLFGAFRKWCEANGEAACDQREFSTRMGLRGFVAKKSGGARWYLGVAPTADEAEESSRYAD